MVEGRDLATEARLDERAAAVVAGLPPTGLAALEAAWDGAVARQERELDEAIEGSLSLLPRLVRGRVVKLLRRGRR